MSTLEKYYTLPRTLLPMPTVKVKEWTKDELDDIKEEEEHSSYDSVIKSLIKEHKARNE